MTRFYLPPKLLDITLHPLPYVSLHYVYEWIDNGTIFYIGMGSNRRAWNTHLPHPENRRSAATNFRIHIFKHNLTKEEAHLIERFRTLHLTKAGLVLLNVRIPSHASFKS